MKKYLKIGALVLLGIAIVYQVYVFFIPEKTKSPSIPDVSLVLLDNTKSTISHIGDNKHTIVFLISSKCDFCKREIKEVKSNLDKLINTEIVFVLFEDLDVIRALKNSILPEESSSITFAKATQEEVIPYLEKDLVYPYMLWYDNNGIQKIQHRGLYPIGRIIEYIKNSD